MERTPLSLIARLKDDPDSRDWREFDAIYRPVLRKYAARCGVSVEDGDDIVQTCMAAIHQNIGRFTHDTNVGRFRAWLRTMVTNRVRNLLAARRPRTADSTDLRNAMDPEAAPPDLFDRIWFREHLMYYLGVIREEVGETTFSPFEAHVIQERTVEEVCDRFGLRPAQLYKLKWRITKMLRDRMSGMIDET